MVIEDAMLDVCRHHIYDAPNAAGPDYDGGNNVRPTTWIDELGCITDSKDECLRLVKLCPIRNAEKAFVMMLKASSQARIRDDALSNLISSLDGDAAGLCLCIYAYVCICMCMCTCQICQLMFVR